jgi:putative glutamine amidotransferase
LPFVIGVQWHPEYLPQLPQQRAIFESLVRQAKARAASATGEGASLQPALATRG